MPDRDMDFIRVPLWQKQVGGVRQQVWKPERLHYPLDHMPEIMERMMCHCCFVHFDHSVNNCFPPYEVSLVTTPPRPLVVVIFPYR